MIKSLSIVGFGHTLHEFLNDYEREYKRPTAEVWGVNSVGHWLAPLCTKIIALDNFRRDMDMDDGKHRQYVLNMLNAGLPIISDAADPEWPQVEAYPWRRVLDNIWPGAKRVADCRPGLVNTINCALALAIADGYEEIRLYGCEFRRTDDAYMIASQAEADNQEGLPYWFPYHRPKIVEYRRDLEPGEPQTMFLLGIAHQRGIRIMIPSGSSLCDMDRVPYLYGPQEQPDVFGVGDGVG